MIIRRSLLTWYALYVPSRQAPVQHQALEDFHRLLQLLTYRCHHRREDFHHARRAKSRLAKYGADKACDATYGCPRYGYANVSAVLLTNRRSPLERMY